MGLPLSGGVPTFLCALLRGICTKRGDEYTKEASRLGTARGDDRGGEGRPGRHILHQARPPLRCGGRFVLWMVTAQALSKTGANSTRIHTDETDSHGFFVFIYVHPCDPC